MKEQISAILFGYGSIGRHHARTLTRAASDLIVVDKKPAAREQIESDFPQAVIVSSFDELDPKIANWSSTVAVIATWGPSHSEIFHKLADRGARRILCEKPMANSITSAREMVSRAQRENIALAVNHFIRYSRVVDVLNGLATTHQFGKPAAVVVEGGAACLVTNGIHWIDFAAQLFNAGIQRVSSTAVCEHINPRSPELGLFGGTAVWSFSDGREAVISFSNQSSIALRARIYYRNAVVEMDADLNAVVRHREKSAIEKFPAVTRTGQPSDVIHEGELPGVVPFEDRLRTAVGEVIQRDVRTAPATVGAEAVSACIGALISAQEKRTIEFPIPDHGPWADQLWPIS